MLHVEQNTAPAAPTEALNDIPEERGALARAGSHFMRGAAEAIPSTVDLGAKVVGGIGKLAGAPTGALTKSDLGGMTRKAYDYVAEKSGLPSGEPEGILEHAASYAGSGATMGGALGGPVGAAAGALGGAAAGAAVGIKRNIMGGPETVGGAIGEAGLAILADIVTRRTVGPKSLAAAKNAHVKIKDVLKHKDFDIDVTGEMVRGAFNKADDLVKAKPAAKVDLREATESVKSMMSESKSAGNADLYNAFQELYFMMKQGNTAEVANEVYKRSKDLASNLAGTKPALENTLRNTRSKVYQALSNSEDKEIASAFSEAMKLYKTDKTGEILSGAITNNTGTGIDVVKLSKFTSNKKRMKDIESVFPSKESFDSFVKSGDAARGLIQDLESKKGSVLLKVAPAFVRRTLGGMLGGFSGDLMAKQVSDRFVHTTGLARKYLRLMEKDAPVSAVREIESKLMTSILNPASKQAKEDYEANEAKNDEDY
jgi:hypothetical protein